MANSNNGSDPLVVSSVELLEALTPLMEQWDREHDNYVASGPWGSRLDKDRTRGGRAYAGGADYPERTSNLIPRKGIPRIAEASGLQDRAVKRILYEQKWITLYVIDKILNGLGLEHWINDGTLTIVPNPRWTQENWITYMKERGCI
jgi:hypothetical protein